MRGEFCNMKGLYMEHTALKMLQKYKLQYCITVCVACMHVEMILLPDFILRYKYTILADKNVI